MYKVNGTKEVDRPNKKKIAKFFAQAFLLKIAKRIKAPKMVIKSEMPYSVPIKIEAPCIIPVKKIQIFFLGWTKQKKNKARVSSAQRARGETYWPMVKCKRQTSIKTIRSQETPIKTRI